MIDHRRRNVFVLPIVRASICYFPFGSIEETEETIITTFIDDTNGLVFALILHKLTDPVACLFHKFVVHAGINEDMVANQTCLSCVQVLWKDDAYGGQIDVRRGRHETSILSAQFETVGVR